MGKIWVLGVSFLTELERSGERLLRAARRVSGSELIKRNLGTFDRIFRNDRSDRMGE